MKNTRDTIVNQLLAGARKKFYEIPVNESYKEKCRRFWTNCGEFKKRVEKRIENLEEEGASDLWELFDKMLDVHQEEFYAHAECYFDEGFRRGFLLAMDLYR